MKNFIKKIRLNKVVKKPLSNSTEEIEAYISELKKYGVSRFRTIGILSDKLDFDLNKTRHIVYNSPSWIDNHDEANPFTEDFLDSAALDAEANDVEFENGKVISVGFTTTNKEQVTSLDAFWDEYDKLCKIVLSRGEQSLFSDLREAQQYTNGLTDGWHDFKNAFEKITTEREMSDEVLKYSKYLIDKLNKNLFN